MEHINRIEIQGNIGSVRVNEVNGSKVANFSVATEHIYKSREAGAVSETTWHHVVAWEGRDTPPLERLSKGTPVNIVGRIRQNRYLSAEGVEKQIYEIFAGKVRILDESAE